MESSERLDRLCMLIFKQGNVQKLREAMNSLFDVFHDILEKDFEYGAYFCAKDIQHRLQIVDKKHWKEIRNLYLYEDYYGYNDGNFSDDEMKDPAKLMMDMLSVLSKCRDGVYHKLDQKLEEMRKLESKADEMRDKAADLYQQLLDEQRDNADRKLEFVKLQTRANLMEKLLEEKKDKITELMKDKNVQLSSKEKEKLLESANQKIQGLEEEVSNLKESKQRYTRRMSTVDDQNKILRLKQELVANGGDSDEETGSEEVQQLKRDIYVKDKDIAHLEDQFYQEQKVVLGIIGGIKTDVNILAEKFYNEEQAVRDPHFVKLTKTLDKIYNGSIEGRLASVKMMLPPHYTYYDNELKVRKLRRLSKAGSLPKLIPQAYPEAKPPLPVIGAALGMIGSTNGTTTSIPETTSKKLETVSENPVIINPKTGQLNSFIYLQHFPHMAEPFVKDHWKKFKEYDKDHDLSLDLQEMASILKSLGCQFTPDQIEEAIEEVDRDSSHTVDFYEYLLVVDKVTKKSGKSRLFKTGLTKQNKEVSKACVVQ